MRPVILLDMDVALADSPVAHNGPALLSPLNDLRPIFGVRTGVLTTLERWSRAAHVGGALVRQELASLAAETCGVPVNHRAIEAARGDVVAVNGACAVPCPEVSELEPGDALVERASGHLVAWRTDAKGLQGLMAGEAAQARKIATIERRVLITRPWHVRTLRNAAIAADLNVLASTPTAVPGGVMVMGGHPIHIAPSARICPGVTLDAEHGPIWIGPDAVVRPGAILCGPCGIGEHSTVLDRALIKANTAIGPHCKVAGEVGGTIIQGYSNKAHDGHLGDSWLGEWVNLGAGTTNSNLLNTYGEVVARALPGGQNERTGEQFLGAIIGDHVKTAICTRLMTGTILHTGSMFAQTAPVSGTIERFRWATDEGHRPYRLSKFVEVMRAAMGRRKIEPSEAYLERLELLHAEGRNAGPFTTEGHGDARSGSGGGAA